MVAHFCNLHDTDPALFRFMLIAQHDLLPQISNGERVPVAVIEDTVADAIAAREINPIDIPPAPPSSWAWSCSPPSFNFTVASPDRCYRGLLHSRALRSLL